MTLWNAIQEVGYELEAAERKFPAFPKQNGITLSPPLAKMLVITVRKDLTKRRIWEDAFVNELAKHGVAATSSYGLFPDVPPDTNQVIATVKANGFDGILVVLMLPTETNKQYFKGMQPKYRMCITAFI